MVNIIFFIFFFKQKTAYEMRISDWSSDVCSSDLDAYKAAYAEFEKQNPDITIKYEVERGGTEALQQFLTAASSNTLPDLALLDGFWISRLVETGKLQPLNDLWGEESRAHRSEERREGKECVSPWRFGWAAYY